MPELPEVEIVKRGLESVLHGATVEECILNRKNLRYPFATNFSKLLKKSKIQNLRRRGKYLLVDFSNDRTLIWHLGMSGRVKTFVGEPYEPEKHDHVIFKLQNGNSVAYNDARRFGFMDLVKTNDVDTCRHFLKMGPEPLGNHFDGKTFHQALKNKKTSIKAALLDQRVVAGVGNIYACEALYMSEIDPRKNASKISANKSEQLAQAIKSVLQKAIEAGGSSLRDYKHTDGSLGYFQHMFSVYDREGELCSKCDCNENQNCGIKRIVQSGRSTFFCPITQK